MVRLIKPPKSKKYRIVLSHIGEIAGSQNRLIDSPGRLADQLSNVRISVRSSDPHGLVCRAWGVVIKGDGLIITLF
jgi:hypothetical protein